MKSDNVGRWLTKQLMDRGLSSRELGRRAGVSHTMVVRIANQVVIPSAEMCIKLADGLGVRREEVLRMARYLPPDPGPFEGRSEALTLLERLDAPIRRSIITTMRNLLGLRSTRGMVTEHGPEYEVDGPRTLHERTAYRLEQEMAGLTPEERDELVERMLRVRDQLNRGAHHGHAGADVEAIA